jgi:hypothetical protein
VLSVMMKLDCFSKFVFVIFFFLFFFTLRFSVSIILSTWAANELFICVVIIYIIEGVNKTKSIQWLTTTTQTTQKCSLRGLHGFFLHQIDITFKAYFTRFYGLHCVSGPVLFKLALLEWYQSHSGAAQTTRRKLKLYNVPKYLIQNCIQTNCRKLCKSRKT